MQHVCIFNVTTARTSEMKSIRRVNLDALWSREPSTVSALTRDVCKGIKLSQSMGIPPPYPDLGPFLDHDDFGYGVALQMVWDLLEPGVYADYKQFDTVQRLRSAFSSVWEASTQGSLPVLAFASDDHKWVTSVTMCPTSSKWFKRFTEGLWTCSEITWTASGYFRQNFIQPS